MREVTAGSSLPTTAGGWGSSFSGLVGLGAAAFFPFFGALGEEVCRGGSSTIGGSSAYSPGSGESDGTGLCSTRGGRAHRGTTRSGRRIGARWVPGRTPRDMAASCSLIAWSRRRIWRSTYRTSHINAGKSRRFSYSLIGSLRNVDFLFGGPNSLLGRLGNVLEERPCRLSRLWLVCHRGLCVRAVVIDNRFSA